MDDQQAAVVWHESERSRASDISTDRSLRGLASRFTHGSTTLQQESSAQTRSIHEAGTGSTKPSYAGESAKSLAGLPSNVPSAILRAAPLHEVLAGCGKHWKANIASAQDYDISACVEELDDFLSHDWGTKRYLKLTALLFVYNQTAACAASALAAVPLAFLGALGDVPVGARLGCPFVWAFLFFFGQQLRGKITGQPRYVFLDKLCIHQTDAAKKAEGILGLAGFLRASKRLVVLWSPRYFTRLWCSYELAAWSYLHSAQVRPVKFMPVSTASVILQFMVAVMVVCILGTILASSDKPDRGIGFYVTHALVGTAAAPLLANILGLIKSFEEIQADVQGYDMHEAKCFCCTHNHLHPETGERIPCDRQLVYKTLLEWLSKRAHVVGRQAGDAHNAAPNTEADEARDRESSDYDSGEKGAERCTNKTVGYDLAVEQFNEEVRSNLLRCVRESTSSSFVIYLSYRDVVCAAVPAFWAGCDTTMRFVIEGDYADAIRWTLEYICLWLCVFPLNVAVTIAFTTWLSKLTRKREVGRRCPRCWHLLSLLAVVVACFASFLFLWIPGPVLTTLHRRGYPPVISDVPMILRFLLLGAVTLHVMKSKKPDATPTPPDDAAAAAHSGQSCRDTPLTGHIPGQPPNGKVSARSLGKLSGTLQGVPENPEEGDVSVASSGMTSI
eukprot:TRINITY_DN22264_c0_g1_i2.p1 TRINITY_DN22264_c0_g1~~TRINITY_DN22264_c0_g1_i2.p1  ORF type:complete len:673 (+),score=98.86 TRINITY_DN22264_c0_g1_i2:169-2187(+)